MLNHVMIGSSDIQKTKAFYTAVLGVLGAGEPMEHVNDTGQTRLFYMHDGSTFSVSEPINGEPVTSVLSVTHLSKLKRFTTRRLPMAVPVLRIHPDLVKVIWVLCICATSLTQMVTKFVAFIVLPS